VVRSRRKPIFIDPYGDLYELRTAKTKDDPSLHAVPGSVEGNWLILTATSPYWDSYVKAWCVNVQAYHLKGPCPCCGQPRGAGSLHP
jgi:hypothetical protein